MYYIMPIIPYNHMKLSENAVTFIQILKSAFNELENDWG